MSAAPSTNEALSSLVDRTAAICARFFPDGLPSNGSTSPYLGDPSRLVISALEYLEKKEPWTMAKHPEQRGELAATLDLLCTRCLEAARAREPDDPKTARRIRERIGEVEAGSGMRRVRTGEPLFYTPPVESPLAPPDLPSLPRYFDTHAHYDDIQFDGDREETLKHIRDAGVELVLVPGCDVKSSLAASQLAHTHSFIYAAAGIHPHEASGAGESELREIAGMLGDLRVKAIGEIGLDYFYDLAPRDVQQQIFRRQLSLAQETGLPVIVHDREAHGDCLKIIDEFPDVCGVFHCFSGSAEYAEELVRRGWFISFTGSVTFKKASKLLLAAKAVPDERIMIETDSPYLAPEPYRGRRNDSSMLRRTCAFLAELRGTDPVSFAELTLENGKRFFGI